ncbi:MAG: LysR family transcriptional regulator [Trueperaceae bacterium]
MRLHQLEVFLTVIDEGTFGSAALALGLSQSSVSHAIRALETDLGVRLLDRGRFGARVTPVGERVAEKARRMMALSGALEQEASAETGTLRGELVLTAFESFSTHVLPEVLAHLRAVHPRLRVRLVEVAETFAAYDAALMSGEIQVAIGAWDVPSTCIAWEIMRDEHLAVLPADSPITADHLDVEDLIGLPLVLSEGSACTVRLLAHLERQGHAAEKVVTAKGNDAILRLVAAGLGATVLPALAVGSPDGIAVRTVPFSDLVRPVLVIVPPHGLKVPAVRAFLHVLKARFPESDLPALSAAVFGTATARGGPMVSSTAS